MPAEDIREKFENNGDGDDDNGNDSNDDDEESLPLDSKNKNPWERPMYADDGEDDDIADDASP